MDDLNEYQIAEILGTTAPIFTGEARFRLKMLRMDALMDQAQLAKLLGVGVATVTNIENGSRMPRNPITMEKFISVFGVRGAIHILTGKYASAFDAKAVHSKYWRHKHGAMGNRTPWREREEILYRDVSKMDLIHEVEHLRKLVKSFEFKKEGKPGKN